MRRAIVLDPTCGSGTTACVAERWARRWITIDTSRVPLALARQRLLTATFDYYELKDEARGPASGFVYKRKQNAKGEEIGGIVLHITLKSIANSEPPPEEVLVDRPEIVSGITRVSGPFAVEATIPTPVDFEPHMEAEERGSETTGDENGANPRESASIRGFSDRLLEVLRKSPILHLGGGRTVQVFNVRRPTKSLVLSAEGLVEATAAGQRPTVAEAFTEAAEKNVQALPLSRKPVAFVFGPENGAVSERLVFEATREAFAKNYAHLYVMGVQIQPNARQLIEDCEQVVGIPATYFQWTMDLVMGDLLKNMRSSQIFSACDLPATFVFRTRMGGIGVAQVQSFTPEGTGLRLRYRVVANGADKFELPVPSERPADLASAPEWVRAAEAAHSRPAVVQWDREPSVEMNRRKGFRLALRRETGCAALAKDERGEVQLRREYQSCELVVFPTAADQPPLDAARLPWTRWIDEASEPRKTVHIGRGMGFEWYAHTNILEQEFLRRKLRLEGGDDRLALLIEGMKAGYDCDIPLAEAEDRALPHIRAAVDEGPSGYGAIRALALIQTEAATAYLKTLYAADATRPRAASALIHQPYRPAAKDWICSHAAGAEARRWKWCDTSSGKRPSRTWSRSSPSPTDTLIGTGRRCSSANWRDGSCRLWPKPMRGFRKTPTRRRPCRPTSWPRTRPSSPPAPTSKSPSSSDSGRPTATRSPAANASRRSVRRAIRSSARFRARPSSRACTPSPPCSRTISSCVAELSGPWTRCARKTHPRRNRTKRRCADR
jgi:hypothetical protein